MNQPKQNIVQPVEAVNLNTLEEKETSNDNKTIITVLLLVFVYPVGFFLMWFWAKWKTWVKFLVSCISCLPFILIIFAILSAGILTAINPAKQFAKARDTQRRADLNSLSTAIASYIVDNQGQLPSGLTKICPETQKISHDESNDNLDLDPILVPKYLNVIASDPLIAASNRSNQGSDVQPILLNTGYEICISNPATNRITISAPKAEGGTPISITR